ncbi:MAG: secondary thiamine-phosphate synthase enzyme YjbQ [Planctomycetaceae bacterium]|nr:secondary thiamine-phosphate synthase enzyme YjbQ [Planctomycetaceae bacterium]
MSLKKFSLDTTRHGLVNITRQVAQAVKESGVQDGLAVVYCPHTTAAITINENADPDVVHDLILGLNAAYPDRADFRHGEGNSAAHLKSSCVGASKTFIIDEGRMVLGTWQGIYFCEFDGPRHRQFFVKVLRAAGS